MENNNKDISRICGWEIVKTSSDVSHTQLKITTEDSSVTCAVNTSNGELIDIQQIVSDHVKIISLTTSRSHVVVTHDDCAKTKLRACSVHCGRNEKLYPRRASRSGIKIMSTGDAVLYNVLNNKDNIIIPQLGKFSITNSDAPASKRIVGIVNNNIIWVDGYMVKSCKVFNGYNKTVKPKILLEISATLSDFEIGALVMADYKEDGDKID